jgi:hypothetical protein
MKSNKFLILFLYFCFIIEINSDCNYITLGANKEKCAVIKKQDEKKSCCYVKIKKHDYVIEYCHEINKTLVNDYKNQFKKNHSLKYVKVECGNENIKIKKFLILIMFLVLFI